MSPGHRFRPDSHEAGPNRTRWTAKETRWVVKERAMVVILRQTRRSPEKLYNWYGDQVERLEWCKLASLLGHRTQPWLSPASESSQTVEIWRHTSLDSQTLMRIVSRVSRRTHLTSLFSPWGCTYSRTIRPTQFFLSLSLSWSLSIYLSIYLFIFLSLSLSAVRSSCRIDFLARSRCRRSSL